MPSPVSAKTLIYGSAQIRVNAAAVYKSLREFGAPLAGLTEADFAEEGYFYQMGIPPVRVDILMGITRSAVP